MPITRANVKRGPAKITVGGITLVPKADVSLDAMIDTFNVDISTLADADERISNFQPRLRFTPDGTVSADILAHLFACADFVNGQSIITESDLVITWKTDGETMTFPAWGIIKPPDLNLSSVETPFGEVEYVFPGKNNTAWSAAAKRLTLATTTYTEAAVPGDIVTESPTVTWGVVSPWDAIKPGGPVKVGFALGTEPDSIDDDGIFDYLFNSLKATVTLQPKGIALSDVIAAMDIQGTGAVRGRSLNAASLAAMNISNSAIYFRLYGAALKTSPIQAGRTANRLGELMWTNTKADATTGVFYIGDAAPA